MSKTEHKARMVFGFILFWVIAMPMPFGWWGIQGGWFRWALPYIGYYAYYPRNRGVK